VPSYYIAENAIHNCTHASMSCGPKLTFLSGDESGDDQETDVHITCAAWPFVQSGTYRSTAAETGIGSLISEVRLIFFRIRCAVVAFEDQVQILCSSS